MTRLTLSILVTFLGASLAEPSAAGIIGLLEAPSGFASQIGNVQGWVYTTTPGAELIQPFDVLVDGEKIMEVPCCSERGDVQAAHPDAPLQTGFSGVTNWAREAGGGPIDVQVVVRDTMGGTKVLEQANVEVFALAGFPFSSLVEWDDTSPFATRCTPSNTGTFTPGAAELVCTNLLSIKGDGLALDLCDGAVRFSWDKASQGFKQTSGCEALPRWTDNGDGTATDNTTGLQWELKTDDGSIHDKDDKYEWCADDDLVLSCDDSSNPPDGPAFTLFLGTLNGGVSEHGATTAGCFAGKCDWRIPTIEELTTIVDLTVPGCGGMGSLCTTIPGETVSSAYMSRSTSAVQPHRTWVVFFFSGGVTPGEKYLPGYVRAVRGGS